MKPEGAQGPTATSHTPQSCCPSPPAPGIQEHGGQLLPVWLHNFPVTDSAFSSFQALGANFQIKTQHDNSLNASCSLILRTRECRPWICGTGQGKREECSGGRVVCVEGRAVTLSPMLGSGQTAEQRRIIPFVVSEGIRTKPAEAKRCQKGLGQQQPHPAVYKQVGVPTGWRRFGPSNLLLCTVSPGPSVPSLEALEHTTGARVAERARVQRVSWGGKKLLQFREEMKPGSEASALPARENKHSELWVTHPVHPHPDSNRMKTQELSGGGRMRKRKKTATPHCTTPEKNTHTSCRGGTVQSATKHLLPPQTPNQATTLIPKPSSLLPPWAVSIGPRGTFVSSPRSGGDASDPLQGREHQRPGARCPALSDQGGG